MNEYSYVNWPFLEEDRSIGSQPMNRLALEISEGHRLGADATPDARATAEWEEYEEIAA